VRAQPDEQLADLVFTLKNNAIEFAWPGRK
jgi:hypothetical protein